MTENEYIWLKHGSDEREELIKLLLSGQRVMAIKHIRTCTYADLKEAKRFVDSAWLCEKVAEANPTRLSTRDELRAEVLRVLSGMFVTISDPDMLMKDKYEILTELDMPKLMDMCTED